VFNKWYGSVATTSVLARGAWRRGKLQKTDLTLFPTVDFAVNIASHEGDRKGD
jgi:hypothetical protein